MATILKPSYSSWSAMTCAFGALASDANLLAGRASTVVDNSSTKYQDVEVAGKVTTHASVAPTANKQIRLYVYTGLDVTPRYPDGITGSDAGKTLTNAFIRENALALAKTLQVSNATGVAYDFRFSLVAVLGFLPTHWGIFIVQDTGQNLDASGSQDLRYRGLNTEVVTS